MVARPKDGGLTEKEELYCMWFLILNNQTEAYIKAGYSAKTANVNAYTLHNKPHIQKRIEELKAERNERLARNADDVYKDLLKIKDSAMTMIQAHTGSGIALDYDKMIDYTNAIKALETEIKYFVTVPKDNNGALTEEPQINTISNLDDENI